MHVILKPSSDRGQLTSPVPQVQFEILFFPFMSLLLVCLPVDSLLSLAVRSYSMSKPLQYTYFNYIQMSRVLSIF